jgi:hypothetical protein
LVVCIAAVGLAACGGTSPGVTSAPAPDVERIQDLVPLTAAEAAQRADRVVLATSRGSRVVEGMPGTPFTRTTFDAERVLKGRLPHRFVIQTIGGRLGTTVVESPLPAFTPGHVYILFLGPDGPAGPTIFPQSVLDVTRAGPRLEATLAAIRSQV